MNTAKVQPAGTAVNSLTIAAAEKGGWQEESK